MAPFAALPLILGSLLGCRGPSAGAAPDFVLPSLSGPAVSLSSQRGKVVLVNFWATWCDACVEELPALRALRARLPPERFALLAVSVDDDASRSVPPFAARLGLDFPVLYGDKAVSEAYAVRMLPTTYLIAPDGSVVRRYRGPLDPRAVENDILDLLKRSPS